MLKKSDLNHTETRGLMREDYMYKPKNIKKLKRRNKDVSDLVRQYRMRGTAHFLQYSSHKILTVRPILSKPTIQLNLLVYKHIDCYVVSTISADVYLLKERDHH